MSKNVRVNITIPESVREDAKKRADKLGLSMSAMIRMMLVKELESGASSKK